MCKISAIATIRIDPIKILNSLGLNPIRYVSFIKRSSKLNRVKIPLIIVTALSKELALKNTHAKQTIKNVIRPKKKLEKGDFFCKPIVLKTCFLYLKEAFSKIRIIPCMAPQIINVIAAPCHKPLITNTINKLKYVFIFPFLLPPKGIKT